MTTAPYIEKGKVLKASEDYSLLRKKGLEHIENLGSTLWTDYNVHDPGITTLEMLCYAITDLGYRTSYPIEDILADKSSGQSSEQKNFFSAREILTCNAVTLNDFRKILIDVPGVKNGWLKIANEAEQSLFVDCKKSSLTLENKNKVEPLTLRGLYEVILEFEKDATLGDLNLYYLTFDVEAAGGAFQIEVLLPPWHNYFGRHQKISNIELVSLTDIAQSQGYKGSLQATFEDGEQLTLPFTVFLTGLKTSENKQAIKDKLEEDKGIFTQHREIVNRAIGIGDEACSRLHASRNLCEDFYRFKGIEIEEIAICADVEITTEADIGTVLAEIYYRVWHFLSPSIRFYTIRELLEKGKRIDEIFEGPVLDHGFIDDQELTVSEFRDFIHVSDIIQIIMDVDGVVAVKSILITNFFNGQPLTPGEEWCIKIGTSRLTRLTMERSKIVFYKGLIPYAAKIEEVQKKLKELKTLDRYNRLWKGEYDLAIPVGQNQNVERYHSIQNDYPLVYAIGKDGLAASASKLRKAQAKQLKGFLLFYEQLLANYLSQLANIKELFALNPEKARTYFTQVLFKIPDISETEVPDVPNLLKDFIDTLDIANRPDIDLDDASTYDTEWQNYLNTIKSDFSEKRKLPDPLVETQSIYEDRKNRFLDHLMARFGEQFTDYVLLMYSLDKKKAGKELIEDKLTFINDYPRISYERGKAFNYKDPNGLWFTDNVSGLQKRATRLLGIRSYLRRFLSHCIEEAFEIYQEVDEDNIDKYCFRLKNETGDILLSNSTHHLNMEDAYMEIYKVSKFGAEKGNYQLETSMDGRFYFNLTDDSGEIIARRIEFFDTAAERDVEIDKVVVFINSHSDCEGFHLIEHILLRPRTPGDRLMNVCVDEDCSACSGFIDPYSFRVTAVVPYWPKRFLNEDFRNFFEATLRMEAPAHVHVKICWVTKEALEIFEAFYFKWLEETSRDRPDAVQLTAYQNDLVVSLGALRSVYPESRLFDCRLEEKENPILLNLSILGTTNTGKR